MPDNIPGFSPTPVAIPPYTLVGGPENIKLLFDEELDDRRTKRSFDQGWETLRLLQAQNAASLSHFVNMGTALAGQVGATAGQQTVSPIRTGTGDSVASTAYTPNRTVDVAAAGVATANEAVAAAIAKSVNDTITAELSALQETISSIATSNAAIASALSALKPTSAA